MSEAMATPDDRDDVACLAATRALLTASFGDTAPGYPDSPGVIAGQLLTTYGGGPVVAMLACMADHLAWPLARDHSAETWATLAEAGRTQLALADPRSPLADRSGPIPEFVALAHSLHALSRPSLHRWAAALYEQHGFWAVAAGTRLIHQLLRDTAGTVTLDPEGPQLVLRDLALRQEAAPDGGTTHHLVRA